MRIRLFMIACFGLAAIALSCTPQQRETPQENTTASETVAPDETATPVAPAGAPAVAGADSIAAAPVADHPAAPVADHPAAPVGNEPKTEEQPVQDVTRPKAELLPLQPKKAVTLSRYYQEGYDRGYDDGEDDAVSGNGWQGQFDDSCPYRGKKRKDYEQGYEEGYEAGFEDVNDYGD